MKANVKAVVFALLFSVGTVVLGDAVVRLGITQSHPLRSPSWVYAVPLPHPSDGGVDAPFVAPPPFIAFAKDFEGFTSWERIPVEGAMNAVGAKPGPTAVYVKARPPPHSTRWPNGSILVKTIEHERMEEWVIHAMVKRGVPYNRDGAIGWEFFELKYDPSDAKLHIVWRGTGPPSGHGYAAQGRDAGPGGIPLVCNDCHAAAWQNDGVLTPALALHP
ncbi:MAG: hypothetical protein NZM37_06660 [Sandaracinaceae bacterium]|nr:hypothetical protein [Sandaracinaceae bacterium]MDW8245054.1 hypothetical protein [Sandaracinaceae bacterium]